MKSLADILKSYKDKDEEKEQSEPIVDTQYYGWLEESWDKYIEEAQERIKAKEFSEYLRKMAEERKRIKDQDEKEAAEVKKTMLKKKQEENREKEKSELIVPVTQYTNDNELNENGYVLNWIKSVNKETVPESGDCAKY